MDQGRPLLIIGGTGQLGRELAECAPELDNVVLRDRGELDLTDRDAITQQLGDVRPGIVVNTAAYSAVDKAETEPELANAVNAAAVNAIARSCREHGASLIHVSTDYVFDGAGNSALLEDDPANPLSAYGRSKLAGEAAVTAELDAHVIVRTSSVFSPFGTNFVKSMIALREREALDIVADQTSGPTSAAALARAIISIAGRLALDGAAAPFGTYHFSGQPAVTWFDFARAIFDQLATDGKPVPILKPITAAAWGAQAARPCPCGTELCKNRVGFRHRTT